MALLRNLEHSLSGLLEGTVGRVFRTEVRPTEIARKLAREMEINKRVSLSRTYAPTDYLVYLSPEDRSRYTGVEDSIADELGAYLLEHARRERLVLVRRPLVVFRTDQRLRLGEFGIEARTAPISAEEAPPRPERSAPPIQAAPRRAPEPQPRQVEPEPRPAPLEELPDEAGDPYADPYAGDPFNADGDVEAPQPAEPPLDDHGPDWLDPIDDWDAASPAGEAPVPWIDPGLRRAASARPVEPPPVQQPIAPAQQPIAPEPDAEPTQLAPPAPRARSLVLLVDGVPHELTGETAVLGRSRTCDIPIADPSISRRHVELRCDEYGWYATDLGSTNGTTLDGVPLTEAQRLAPGQRLALGHAAAVIEVR